MYMYIYIYIYSTIYIYIYIYSNLNIYTHIKDETLNQIVRKLVPSGYNGRYYIGWESIRLKIFI
jgi:hypothetical protein